MPRQRPTSVQVRARSSTVVSIRGRRPGTVTSTQRWPTRGSPGSTSSTVRSEDCQAGRLRGSTR